MAIAAAIVLQTASMRRIIWPGVGFQKRRRQRACGGSPPIHQRAMPPVQQRAMPPAPPDKDHELQANYITVACAQMSRRIAFRRGEPIVEGLGWGFQDEAGTLPSAFAQTRNFPAASTLSRVPIFVAIAWAWALCCQTWRGAETTTSQTHAELRGACGVQRE